MKNHKYRLEILKNGFMLDDKPFYLASGDMHYFRYFEEGWRRRLQLMKDFGLTAVQTYVPWNMHEPEEDEFNFEGNLNIAKFLGLCDEIGLKVLLRPAPYICSEWDWGGLPYWLQAKKCAIRTNDPKYMECLKKYYERLTKEFIPYLSANGGPIIAVAIENEYGSFSDDAEYLKMVGKMLEEMGVDSVFYTANGVEKFKMKAGSRPEYYTTFDFHGLTDEMINDIKEYQPDKPIMAAEFWAGRSQQWGGYFMRQKPEDVQKAYTALLDKGVFVNFYMFCGGSNFGFHNGALVGRYGADVEGAPNRYIPFATSYDVDAPITEYGYPTEKYYLCKAALKEYLKKNNIEFTGSADMGGYECKTQSISNVKLTQAADVLDNVKNISAKRAESGFPLTFTDMGLDYGFMLYSTEVPYTDDSKRSITIDGLQDRATIYVNGEYIGTLMRDRVGEKPVFTVPKDGAHIDILVENMGRVNYGTALLFEKKGICGYVRIEVLNDDGSIYPWNYSVKSGWINTALPFNNLENLDYTKTPKAGRPTVYEGKFMAEPGVDTFFNYNGLEKGFVEINGFNIGRYWSVGPQKTLYVPGELLKEENTIRIMDIYNTNEEKIICFEDKPLLDSIEKTCDLQVSVVG